MTSVPGPALNSAPTLNMGVDFRIHTWNRRTEGFFFYLFLKRCFWRDRTLSLAVVGENRASLKLSSQAHHGFLRGSTMEALRGVITSHDVLES